MSESDDSAQPASPPAPPASPSGVPGVRQYDLLIVGIGLVAVVVLAFGIIAKFPTAAEASQVAAVMLSAVTAIVSAAFGIAQTQVAAQAQKAAAEADAQKKSAEERVRTKDRLVMNVRSAVESLRRDHEAFATRAAAGVARDDPRRGTAAGADADLVASLQANLVRVDEATKLALSS